MPRRKTSDILATGGMGKLTDYEKRVLVKHNVGRFSRTKGGELKYLNPEEAFRADKRNALNRINKAIRAVKTLMLDTDTHNLTASYHEADYDKLVQLRDEVRGTKFDKDFNVSFERDFKGFQTGENIDVAQAKRLAEQTRRRNKQAREILSKNRDIYIYTYGVVWGEGTPDLTEALIRHVQQQTGVENIDLMDVVKYFSAVLNQQYGRMLGRELEFSSLDEQFRYEIPGFNGSYADYLMGA